MRNTKWRRVREATAVADNPALLRPGSGGDPDGDGDLDVPGSPDDTDNDAKICPGCQGTGIKGSDLCPTCKGAGFTVRESTSGPYWVYSDDPEWEKLREANRTFSTDVRKKYAAAGVALPDGSYPIPDLDALGRAISSFGHNATAAVKAHIVKRAKALGATSKLPADWQSSGKSKESMPLLERLEVLEDKLDSEQQFVKSVREAKPQHMAPAFSNPARVKTSDGREGYRIWLIKEGKGNSDDDQWYTADSIREMCESGVAEGMQAFGDHPTEEEEEQRPERSVKELVGSYHDVKFKESNGKAVAEAIFVPLTYDENHPRFGWVVTLAEAAVRSTAQQPICGISLFGLSAGDDTERPDGTVGRVVSMIRPQSGDIVTNAGAGGGFIRQLMESARALRNKSKKELDPMKSMAYQAAVRERTKRVREAKTDDERETAIAELEKLEGESIDNVPDTIEQLREAAPSLMEKIRESVAQETKAEADSDLESVKKERDEAMSRLSEANSQLGGITKAIGITEALREAGVEDSIELRHYANEAHKLGLTDKGDIKEMVETAKAFKEHEREQTLAAIRESIGADFESDIEGVVARVPAASSMPTDGGVEALEAEGIPIKDAE